MTFTLLELIYKERQYTSLDKVLLILMILKDGWATFMIHYWSRY